MTAFSINYAEKTGYPHTERSNRKSSKVGKKPRNKCVNHFPDLGSTKSDSVLVSVGFFGSFSIVP